MFEPESLTVVVPVYNSEQTLERLLIRLEPVIKAHARRAEVLLVNDGSRDQSWPVIEKLSRQYAFVRGIDLMRNYGQHNALLCGIRQATGRVVITLDDDLQHPPEEIPKLLSALKLDVDVVYGCPERIAHGLTRRIASVITKIALQSAIGVQTARRVSAFRVFRSHLRDAFESYNGPFVSIDVLLSWATTRFTSVSVQHDERLLAASNYSFRKLVVHALNMMTGFSTAPLQIASMIGFTFTVFGGGALLVVFVRYALHGSVVPGFAFLASLIAILSGAQLFCIGIMGEYLARMHFRTMDKPTYAVRRATLAQTEQCARI